MHINSEQKDEVNNIKNQSKIIKMFKNKFFPLNITKKYSIPKQSLQALTKVSKIHKSTKKNQSALQNFHYYLQTASRNKIANNSTNPVVSFNHNSKASLKLWKQTSKQIKNRNLQTTRKGKCLERFQPERLFSKQYISQPTKNCPYANQKAKNSLKIEKKQQKNKNIKCQQELSKKFLLTSNRQLDYFWQQIHKQNKQSSFAHKQKLYFSKNHTCETINERNHKYLQKIVKKQSKNLEILQIAKFILNQQPIKAEVNQRDKEFVLRLHNNRLKDYIKMFENQKKYHRSCDVQKENKFYNIQKDKRQKEKLKEDFNTELKKKFQQLKQQKNLTVIQKRIRRTHNLYSQHKDYNQDAGKLILINQLV